MLLWVILLVVAAVGLYAIIIFDSLVRTRQMANESWSGIDVQLKRHSELVRPGAFSAMPCRHRLRA